MQRATASTGRWMGALGAGLALTFFSMIAQAGAFDGRSLAVFAAAPAVSGVPSAMPARWRDYALASITPRFSWSTPKRADLAPSVLDSYAGTRGSAFEFSPAVTPSPIGVSFMVDDVNDTPGLPSRPSSQLVDLPNPGLQRTVVAPSLGSSWGGQGDVRLTGVLAYQRFASLGLGMTEDVALPLPVWFSDTSYGVGARIDVANMLGDRLKWQLGYQSRVGMGAFSHYRGVFADAGDFDIPASGSVALSYALTPSFALDAGVERINYSTITPFTSSNLPTRFLALLGDSASPVFAWRDLDVYSLGWTLRDDDIGNLQMRYTTRQQPEPTSRLLADALEPYTADNLFSMGWSRPFGNERSLSLTASYATSPYYLLMPTYVPRSDATAGRFEFEALWTARF
jgi:hypothetical protein